MALSMLASTDHSTMPTVGMTSLSETAIVNAAVPVAIVPPEPLPPPEPDAEPPEPDAGALLPQLLVAAQSATPRVLTSRKRRGARSKEEVRKDRRGTQNSVPSAS